MPKLDLRLKLVARLIRSKVHADIGSDHGHLLVALLKSGRIEHGIAIENKHQPFLNSERALAGLECDVRLGDGLDGLKTGETDSLSICGMGATTIVEILTAHLDRIPNQIVLQPNLRSDLVRRWALDNRFHLVNEAIATGRRRFDVMAFQRSDRSEDPAYDQVDVETGVTFGPLNLKRNDATLRDWLEEEREYLQSKPRLNLASARRSELIQRAIEKCSQLAPPN